MITKDFIAIGSIIKKYHLDNNLELMNDLINVFRKANSNFNYDQFMKFIKEDN